MLCDKCKQNQASVLIQQNVNGDITEMNLCAECAESSVTSFSFDKILKNFMKSLMGHTGGMLGKEDSGVTSVLQCPSCGLTYDGFKSGGKLGCADCYSAFRNQLITLFKNVHGSASHMGKLPHKGGAQLIRLREMDKLKKQLKMYIDEEEYEKAAEIRDRIKELTI